MNVERYSTSQTTTRNLPKISVVVLGYNNYDITCECIESVIKASWFSTVEIIYVDNGSRDWSYDLTRLKFKGIDCVKIDKNVLYGGGMNAGIIKSHSEIILCLNNDTVIDKNCLVEIVEYMKNDSIGCANTKILRYKTNKHDMSICKLKCANLIPYSVDYDKEDTGQCDTMVPDYANGCALVLRREALSTVGLFNKKYDLYWEDVDLSFRIKRAGYRIGFIPKAVVWHKGGYTTKKTPFNSRWKINKNRIKFLLDYRGRK